MAVPADEMPEGGTSSREEPDPDEMVDTPLTGLWTSGKSEQSDSVAVEDRSLLPTETVDNRGDSEEKEKLYSFINLSN